MQFVNWMGTYELQTAMHLLDCIEKWPIYVSTWEIICSLNYCANGNANCPLNEPLHYNCSFLFDYFVKCLLQLPEKSFALKNIVWTVKLPVWLFCKMSIASTWDIICSSMSPLNLLWPTTTTRPTRNTSSSHL